MTSSPAPSSRTAAAGRPRARWRRAVAGVLMAGALAVTTACGIASDTGTATADTSGTSSASAASSGGTSGSSDASGSGGTTLGQGSTTVTHATSQGS